LARWATPLIDAQVGVALVVGVYAVVTLSGGQASPVMPLVYFLVAFTVTFLGRAAVAASLALCVGFEALALVPGGSAFAAATHAGYIALAAVAHSVFLRGVARRLRRAHATRLEAEVRRLHDEAREFRLIACALGMGSRPARPRPEEERMLA